MAKIHIFRAKNGQYYVRIDAHNGEPILTSETYVSKPNARRAAEGLLVLMPTAIIVDAEAEALRGLRNMFR